MGQYYTPINVDRMEYIVTHECGSGLKLMEHSWLGNSVLNTVEYLLMEGNEWHKDRIVWAGDYMDEDIFIPEEWVEKYKEMEWDYSRPNLEKHVRDHGDKIQIITEIDEQDGRIFLVKDEDYEYEVSVNIDKLDEKSKFEPRYIVNYDKEEYVDKHGLPVDHVTEYDGEVNNWIIHPLSILTCSGNGRGGGDYCPENVIQERYIGRWAGDRLGVLNEKPEGFKEIRPNFTEER